jgi:hypothetical protein
VHFFVDKRISCANITQLGWQQSGTIPRGLIEVLRFLYAKKLRKKRGRVLETLVLDLEFERTSGVEVLRGFEGLGSARILGDGAKGLKMDITITRDRLFHEVHSAVLLRAVHFP